MLAWIGIGGPITEQNSESTATLAVITSDLCLDSFEGGVGEPRFCKLDGVGRVATPFFSVNV
jgi:hypothetical protein